MAKPSRLECLPDDVFRIIASELNTRNLGLLSLTSSKVWSRVADLVYSSIYIEPSIERLEEFLVQASDEMVTKVQKLSFKFEVGNIKDRSIPLLNPEIHPETISLLATVFERLKNIQHLTMRCAFGYVPPSWDELAWDAEPAVLRDVFSSLEWVNLATALLPATQVNGASVTFKLVPVPYTVPLSGFVYKYTPLESMTCLDLQNFALGLQQLPNVTIDCNIPVKFSSSPEEAIRVAALKEQQVSMANPTQSICIRRYLAGEPNDAVDGFAGTKLQIEWQPAPDLGMPRPGHNTWHNLVELNIDTSHAGVWGTEDQPAVSVVLSTFCYPALERLSLTGVKPSLLQALSCDAMLLSGKTFPKLAFIAIELHETPWSKGQTLLESFIETQQSRGRAVEPRLKIVLDSRGEERQSLVISKSLVASLASLSVLFGERYPADFSPSLEYHSPICLPNVRALEIRLAHGPHSAHCFQWLFDILSCPNATTYTVTFGFRACSIAVLTGNLHKLPSKTHVVMKWGGLGHDDDTTEVVYLQLRCKSLGIKLTIVDHDEPHILP